jgi:hypothetical protein
MKNPGPNSVGDEAHRAMVIYSRGVARRFGMAEGLWIAYAGCGSLVKDRGWLSVTMLMDEEWELSAPGYEPPLDEV